MFTLICADVLCGSYPYPGIPKTVFMELIEIDTISLEFIFNKIMYRQKDGIAMGNSLRPTFANISVYFIFLVFFFSPKISLQALKDLSGILYL